MFSWFIKALGWLGLDNLVRVADNWEKAKPMIKHDGLWRFAKRVFTKVNGEWQLVFNQKLVIDISTNQTNFNLFKAIGSVLPETEEIEVNIKSGVVMVGSDAAIPAFKLGNAFAGKIVTINNWGNLYGRGGRGGGGSSALNVRGGNGGDGGTALDVSESASKITLRNYGNIYGGGGGGGGGGGHDFQNWNGSWIRCRGGQGGNGGTGGNGGGGANGQVQRPNADIKVEAGRGGNGGRYGVAGSNGGNHKSTIYGQPVAFNATAGIGGRAGYSINGLSKLLILKTGSMSGAKVN
ncbi:hypothetical protein L1D13_10805 [Vibrio tubiashii]|uniref:hypothetical protein n=1 Tax=Vibrio tubiashii TaxID=29498 RepID=UPI001EFD13C4|nr:hypothetical protein [Vibrio tubiashii]MCG9584619.1 hypothetical protein [Vibrio tubiashii]MCG9618147.1 hypothetical protein [Vibrio tubiashii]MCG9687412.1 hypothetical protein [Vibrio tubiashii]